MLIRSSTRSVPERLLPRSCTSTTAILRPYQVAAGEVAVVREDWYHPRPHAIQQLEQEGPAATQRGAESTFTVPAGELW